MNDDLNVSRAIGVVSSWVNGAKSPTRADAALMREIDGAFGVLELAGASAPTGGGSGGDGNTDGARIDALVAARQEARKNKDFAESDRIRDELDAMGVLVEDTPDGPKWSMKTSL